MKTTIPDGYRPDRFMVWCRYMRIHRKTLVSFRSKEPKPLIVT
jgi:hypothetical protein